MRTPISIITGYLGAGKTTLLQRILEKTDKKIAIIMNEFGEIAIDAKIVKGKNVNIAELAGGCVCCSLTGEFEAAVKEIIEKIQPDMIIVETTGVAEPDSIIDDVRDNLPGVKLDSVITIADADSLVKYPRMGHTGQIQIEMADVILLNKIDLVSREQLTGIRKMLKEMNSRAMVVETERCHVDTGLLFGFETEKKTESHEPHMPEETWFSYSSGLMDMMLFEEFVEAMPKQIYRAKGFVKFPEGTFLFSYVSGRAEMEPGEGGTEIVFIGIGADKVKSEILERLKECELK
ncbi:GTP-binding protein [Candidatus Woesearchaeota archaeon]|nr:GTP-binding protein [Candidatus Woesearchaeota archaeon]